MAFTTPGTAVAGEVLTAAFWNEQVRDNISDLDTRANAVGLVLVNATTLTATTAVDIDGVFTSTYANYKVIIGASHTASAGVVNVSAQLRASGVTYTGSEYLYVRNLTNGDGTQTLAVSTGTTSWPNFGLANGTAGGSYPSYSHRDIFAPQLSAHTQFGGVGFFANNLTTQASGGVTTGLLKQTTAYDGIRFTSSAAVTGTIKIYGYLNS
jgi:hypothetical protein